MKIGDLVKFRSNRSRNPLLGIIVAIDTQRLGWVGTCYVVRWQGFDDVSPFTQRHEYADIQVLSEA